MIANLGDADCAGHWIKASVGSDGSTVTNSRNQFMKTCLAAEKTEPL
jgi:hypothetical protein